MEINKFTPDQHTVLRGYIRSSSQLCGVGMYCRVSLQIDLIREFVLKSNGVNSPRQGNNYFNINLELWHWVLHHVLMPLFGNFNSVLRTYVLRCCFANHFDKTYIANCMAEKQRQYQRKMQLGYNLEAFQEEVSC